MNLYSIRNEKLGFSNRPLFAENDAEALNYIQNVLMADADRALLGLKNDLALYFIGVFDSERGVLERLYDPDNDCSTSVKICDLVDLFNTIPEDKIPRSERQISENLRILDEKFSALSDKLATLKVDKKGNVTYGNKH